MTAHSYLRAKSMTRLILYVLSLTALSTLLGIAMRALANAHYDWLDVLVNERA